MELIEDLTGRYKVKPECDDTILHLQIEGDVLGVYQGHTSQAITDKLESLDCTNWFNTAQLDQFIDLLIDIKIKMEENK